MLKYDYNDLFVWVAYSLGSVTRDDGNQIYPTSFDRRHNLNFLVSKALWMGIGIRPTYGGSINVEYLIADKYRVGYAFDYPYNRLRTGHIGSHEIFLGLDLNTRRSRLLSPRYF